MPAYTDEEIRKMKKITCKIAGDYLGISSMAVSIGMRNNLLPIGFAIHNEERDRAYSESWSFVLYLGRRITSVILKRKNLKIAWVIFLLSFMKDPKRIELPENAVKKNNESERKKQESKKNYAKEKN